MDLLALGDEVELTCFLGALGGGGFGSFGIFDYYLAN